MPIPLCYTHGTPMRLGDLCRYCDGSGEEPNTFLCPLRCDHCRGTGLELSCQECDDELADAREDDEGMA